MGCSRSDISENNEYVSRLACTGVNEIDSEHARIILSLSALKNMMEGRHDPKVACKVLEVILDDMKWHCAREEALAIECGVGGGDLEVMRREHAMLAAEYEKICAGFRNCADVPKSACIDGLIDAALFHIQSYDVPAFLRRRYRR